MNNMFELWLQCNALLKKYFIFDKVFDLMLYDHNFDKLKIELTALKKDSYDINYRFIFLHYDTDYYIYPNTPGIMLTNLQGILSDLNIPNHFCLIITNHNNLSTELEYLKDKFTIDQIAISNIFCQLQNCHVTPALSDPCINISDITKHYTCFNNSKRNHRHTLIKLLAHDKLLSKGIISYAS